MGDFKINEKTVFTQSGGGEPAMGSTITDIPAAGVTGTLVNAVQDNITRLGTVATANLSNTAIIHPTGYVHQTTILSSARTVGSSVNTSLAAFTDSGIYGSFTTRRSADDSMLLFDFYTGMFRLDSASREAYSTLCVTDASDTTYDDDNDPHQAGSNWPNRFGVAYSGYSNAFQRMSWYHKPTGAVPVDLPSYTAGQTLHIRIFIKVNIADCNYILAHASSSYMLTVTEVEI